MNKSVLIKPAKIEDIPRILELYRELAITRQVINYHLKNCGGKWLKSTYVDCPY